MGAQRDPRRPADADTARDRGARLRRALHARGAGLGGRGVRAAHAARAHERAWVPSLREYAACYQINGRRLSPRQVLMHPGPVNRGVELSGEVVDSPQAVITAQVEAGVVVRMAVLYELLRRPGTRRPAPERSVRRARTPGVAARAGMSPLICSRPAHPRRAAAARRARARPARGHRRAPRRARARGRGRRARQPGAHHGPQADEETIDGRGPACCCRPSLTRTCTCARPGRSTRRTSRRAPARPPRAGSARVIAMPNTDPVHRLARRCCARCATPPRARRACRWASWRRSRAGWEGGELTEMAELREEGALGFTDDGRPVASAGTLRKALQYQRLCGGVIGAARGGPDALARRLHARGRGQRRARHRRDPDGERVDDGRARRRAGEV